VGSQEKEFMGNGSVITVTVHDASGTPLSSPATVKLFRGVVPSGQRDASRGVAEFVVIGLGEFTVVAAAPGYAKAQKDVSVDITGRARVDVYLRPVSGTQSLATVPGKPLLAPKAKEAPAVALLVAQSLTAVGRFEDAAQVLREFLGDHASTQEAATARRWLKQLAANGKIRSN
jgi:hypothetical protein